MKLKMKTFLFTLSLVCYFGCWTKKDEDQVVVKKLPTIREKINFANSPNLVIRTTQNKYQAYFKTDSISTSDISQLDTFILKRIKMLDKETILVICEPDSMKIGFTDLKEVLKKNEIYKFRIESQDEVY
jgi:hypothetical protein